MDQLKTIKPKVGYTFEANGKNYIIEDKLSIARSVKASKFELELFELNTTNVKNQLISAYNDLNGSNKDKTVKFADAAIKIHNLVNKIDKNLNFQQLPVLRYCALYINEEKEDRRTISEEQIAEKIQNWQDGGLELSGFFLLVLSVLPSVKKDFSKFMEATLKKESQSQSNNIT